MFLLTWINRTSATTTLDDNNIHRDKIPLQWWEMRPIRSWPLGGGDFCLCRVCCCLCFRFVFFFVWKFVGNSVKNLNILKIVKKLSYVAPTGRLSDIGPHNPPPSGGTMNTTVTAERQAQSAMYGTPGSNLEKEVHSRPGPYTFFGTSFVHQHTVFYTINNHHCFFVIDSPIHHEECRTIQIPTTHPLPYPSNQS